MNIIQITPGAGGMFCGGCFRDNALVAELRRQGHETLMVPLYLPLTLDEADQTEGTPIFFSGINVYLEQKSDLYLRAPAWLKNVLAHPALLKFAGKFAGRTKAADVGEIALSMLRGEEGRQARELEDLIAWLKTMPRPDVISLSNALLAGMARRLKSELKAPVVCVLQGEDTFLDALPVQFREASWGILRSRVKDVDLFIAPSRYFADLMISRLGMDKHKVKVISNGISLESYETPPPSPQPPVLGYFARMCADKGLGIAVETYLRLRQSHPGIKIQFHIGGGCGPGDQPFVDSIKSTLQKAGFAEDVKFFPNVTRAGKVEFFRGLTVFSTPALYGEAFGLYVIEAMAAGIPVVQPRHAAFPELLEATGGGLLADPNPADLAEKIAQLLQNPVLARKLGEAGRAAVLERYNISCLAKNTISAYTGLL